MSEKFTVACFSDIHNNFCMLEPPYKFRGTALLGKKTILEKEGKVDLVMVGGDAMSDYPGWITSGNLPYKYYLGFKDLMVNTFAEMAKDEKVMYTPGNHDYAQGEESKDGPGKDGKYNSDEFYFTGPMNKTLGELSDDDMYCVVSKHTEEKYVLAYHYNIEGHEFFSLAPDPDMIWKEQAFGMNEGSLIWLKNKLNEVDPNGDKPLFVSCHYPLVACVGRRNCVDTNVYNTLYDVFTGHKNLFYIFGHWHTIDCYAKESTTESIVHFDKDGKPIDMKFNETSSNDVEGYKEGTFTNVYMGGFRIDYSAKYFNDDIMVGFGGYTDKVRAFPATGTPKLSQGMFFTIYDDRVEFSMRNYGTYEGFETEHELKPYTVYFK